MKNNKYFKWWKYAASTLPFLALSVLILADFFEWRDFYSRVIILVVVGFLSIAAIWWWWAIDKIIYLSGLIITSERKFQEIKTEIKKIKNGINSVDSDDR